MLSFLGRVIAATAGVLAHPSRFRTADFVVHVETTGLRALPIVGLLAFLIGIVLAYQGAQQLRQFGAEVFAVNLLGLSILREIGILMTAVVVAGRSGSAFTAQIGTMKLSEEVDALRAMGFDPITELVLPRMMALLLTLPLLGFFADIVALLGGMVASWALLDISPEAFVNQLSRSVDVSHVWVGMIKTPFFAAVIAMVGCYQGMAVTGGARAVGHHTTMAVVLAIFYVILIDAIFSVIYQMLGW